ncbi:MAG: hypothetical protein Q9218_002807 [Villophora microphyllina]
MAQARIIVVGISEAGTEAAEWDKNTWPELETLARDHPEAGVHFQDTAIYNRKKDVETTTGKYLAEKLKAEPCSGQHADVIVNCTGLSAFKLGGVEDKNMMPIRGQTVLVRNEANVMCSSSGTDDGDEEVCYLMQRAAGGGTLLGGSYQRGNWDSQLDPSLAVRIMKRAVDLCPALTGGRGIEHLDIIRQGVGLRPYRHGGTRIEKEKIKGVWIVHNYGHGGYGYQSSYGCSQKAVKLVGEALTPRPRL